MLFFLFQCSWGQWIYAFAPSFTVISNVLSFFHHVLPIQRRRQTVQPAIRLLERPDVLRQPLNLLHWRRHISYPPQRKSPMRTARGSILQPSTQPEFFAIRRQFHHASSTGILHEPQRHQQLRGLLVRNRTGIHRDVEQRAPGRQVEGFRHLPGVLHQRLGTGVFFHLHGANQGVGASGWVMFS